MKTKMEIAGYDINPRKKWCLCFDTLYIKEDHRKILNRQPQVRLNWINKDIEYMWFIVWNVDVHVMSN